jgi:hypothetical protein
VRSITTTGTRVVGDDPGRQDGGVRVEYPALRRVPVQQGARRYKPLVYHRLSPLWGHYCEATSLMWGLYRTQAKFMQGEPKSDDFETIRALGKGAGGVV